MTKKISNTIKNRGRTEVLAIGKEVHVFYKALAM
jgi:hypothetical protein